MRFRLSEWMAAGAIFLVVFLAVMLWGWRYLRMEKTALAAMEPTVAAAPAAASASVADQVAPGPEPAAVEAPPEPTELFVHVAGAVRNPGVYQLSVGARVFEAVTKAGGPTDEALLDRINLAQPVDDGTQIYVPAKGDETAMAPNASAPSAGSSASATSSSSSSSSARSVKVDINRAPSAELQKIPGIGPSLAEKIIRHRETNGPFRTVDDLVKVSGIGPATLEKIRPYATVSR